MFCFDGPPGAPRGAAAASNGPSPRRLACAAGRRAWPRSFMSLLHDDCLVPLRVAEWKIRRRTSAKIKTELLPPLPLYMVAPLQMPTDRTLKLRGALPTWLSQTNPKCLSTLCGSSCAEVALRSGAAAFVHRAAMSNRGRSRSTHCVPVSQGLAIPTLTPRRSYIL